MRKRVNEGGKGDQENESLFEGVEFLKKRRNASIGKTKIQVKK